MEGYFESQAYGSVTSDRTLAKLDMPRMDAETLTKTLEGINMRIVTSVCQWSHTDVITGRSFRFIWGGIFPNILL